GNTLTLWSTATGEEMRRFVGKGGGVESITFSLDGKTIASGSKDGTVRLWDLVSCREARRLEGEQPVESMVLSQDGERLAVLDCSGIIRLWGVASGKLCRQLQGLDVGDMQSLAISPDGRSLFCGGREFVVERDSSTGEEVRRFRTRDNPFSAMALSLDG